jgi:sec-independent protein translocase protein TatA
MFGNIGMPELIIIFVIILLLFGGRKLPEVGQNLGKAIKSFKDGISGSVADLDKKEDPATAEASSSAQTLADRSAGRSPVKELPREADAAPSVPAAQREPDREPAKRG